MTHTSIYHMTDSALAREASLIEEAKRDPSKFAGVYEKYYEQIFRYIYQRVNDQDIAADICSQTFLKAMTNLYKFEFKGVPFGSWLYRIASNEMNLFFRENKKNRCVNVETEALSDMIEETEEEDNGAKREVLIDLLRSMEEDDLNLIEMRYFEKRSFKEIGEILDITENNAKVKTYRIIERIKKKLK